MILRATAPSAALIRFLPLHAIKRENASCFVEWLAGRGCRAPKLAASERSSVGQGPQLGPGQLRMNSPAEAAVRSGNHILPANGLRVANNPVGNHLAMLQHICLVSHYSRYNGLAVGKLYLFPDFPFMLVLGVG